MCQWQVPDELHGRTHVKLWRREKSKVKFLQVPWRVLASVALRPGAWSDVHTQERVGNDIAGCNSLTLFVKGLAAGIDVDPVGGRPFKRSHVTGFH